MVRRRRTEYLTPVESVPHDQLIRRLISASPAFATEGDGTLWPQALPPPGNEYPMIHEPAPGEANCYRNWLINVLDVLVDCYPAPTNLALDCLRKSLIEVNRGLTPNLFKPAKRAKGGKANFAAQAAMDRAITAASYIHDECGNDASYETVLKIAGTSRREVEAWKGRVDLSYSSTSTVSWYDLKSAEVVLRNSIADYRVHSPRKAKPAS